MYPVRCLLLVLTLSVSVSSGLAAGKTKAPPAPVGELLGPIPADVQYVFYFDFKSLRTDKTSLDVVDLIHTSAYLAPPPRNPSSGISPEKQADQGVTALRGYHRQLTLLKGTFTAKPIETYFTVRNKKEKILTHKKHPLIPFDERRYLTLLGTDRVVISLPDEVKQVLDAPSDNPSSITKSKAYQALLQRVDYSAAIWALGIVPPSIKKMLAKTPYAALGTITQWTASAHAKQGFIVKLLMDCQDAAAAMELHKFLLSKLNALEQNKILALVGLTSYIKLVKLSRQDKTVTLEGTFTTAQIGFLLTVTTQIMRALR